MEPTASRKRAKVGEKDEAATPAPSPTGTSTTVQPLLHGDALKLPLRWLLARDAGRSERVCRHWYGEISTAYDVWRDVATNTSSELVVKAMLTSELGSELCAKEQTEGSNPTFNFRRLAAGLSQGFPKDDFPEDKVPLPEPTLKPADLFFLVELQRANPNTGNSAEKKRETVAAYCCTDCSAWFDSRLDVVMSLEDMDQPLYTVKGENPLVRVDDVPIYCEEMLDEILREAEDASQHFVKLTLFRRDNGRSICLVQGAEVNEILEPLIKGAADRHGELERFVSWAYFATGVCPTPRLFAANESGAVARILMNLRGMNDINFDISVEFRPDISSLEKGWFRTLLDNEASSTVPFTEKDKEEFSLISHFSLHMTHIIVTPKCGISDDCCNDHFKDEKDLLLVLEGLEWK